MISKSLQRIFLALGAIAAALPSASGQELTAGFLAASPCALGLCEASSDLSHDALDPAPFEMIRPVPASGSNLLNPDLTEKRLFGVIPNYRAEQKQAIYTPLGTKQKFAIARSDSFDWPNYLLLVGYAMQSQVASGGFGHNGGTSGFAKFYARSVGDQIIGSYVTEAILPSIFHEDPRFFRLGSGTILRRAGHAAVSVLVTKKDDGRSTFNFAEIAGNVGVVALTTSYYPDSRTASESVERLGMALGNDVISNLVTEFWPDIKRHLRARKRFGAKVRLPNIN